MRIPFVLALVALAAAPVAVGAATSFPFSFVIDDCRAFGGTPGGGCRAEMAGTLEADCEDSCLFRLAGTVSGTRADAPLATAVRADGLVVYEVPSSDPDFNDGASQGACAAEAEAPEVSCAFDLTFTGASSDWGQGYGRCSFVGIDVSSETTASVAGVALPVATHSARSASQPGDSRPPAIGWEFCVEDGEMQVIEYVRW